MEKRYTFHGSTPLRRAEWKEVTEFSAIDYMIRALLEFQSTGYITIHKENRSIDYRLKG